MPQAFEQRGVLRGFRPCHQPDAQGLQAGRGGRVGGAGVRADQRECAFLVAQPAQLFQLLAGLGGDRAFGGMQQQPQVVARHPGSLQPGRNQAGIFDAELARHDVEALIGKRQMRRINAAGDRRIGAVNRH